MRRNSSQLDLFDWTPPTPVSKRAACIAAFAHASAAAVARAHGVSRSSVLGYVHRARQAGLPVPSRPARVPGGKGRVADIVPVRPVLPVPSVRPATIGTPMPAACRDLASVVAVQIDDLPALMMLSDRQCRAIIDDEGSCCGLPTEGRSSWCRAHRAAYRASARPVRIREDVL